MKYLLIILLTLSFSFPAYSKNEDKNKKVKSLPPGLQKKYERTGTLPPGWQKKIVKGEVLDPYLYAIARRYPIRPADYHLKPIQGTELLRLEDRILRIMNDTKVVLDVFGITID